MEQRIIKVVICDDHAVYRQGIKYILSTKPDIAVIGEAEDGLKLIKLLKHVQPDVILLDINMPVMDGVATITELKRDYPGIKVLILSMQNTPQMIKIMMGLGADGYLTKNDNEDLIYTAIKNCADNGRYINKRTEDVLIDAVRSIKVTESETEGYRQYLSMSNKDIEEEEKISKSSTEGAIFSVNRISKYKWILRSAGIGLVAAAIILAVLYLYRGISSVKNPVQEYTPPIERPQ